MDEGARAGGAGEAPRDVEHADVRVGEGLHAVEIQVWCVGPLDILGRAQVLYQGGDAVQRRLVTWTRADSTDVGFELELVLGGAPVLVFAAAMMSWRHTE